ncbi:SMP-30/gluconolactonase/LRE family protein [Candidatus Pantoea deserta]|uniref:SMP-30/gluconolactonase/LRE family protein n=1 Tax=Candidatus Pantoea deserta TaxID=1869313 RepID=A0A3N4NML4_9GAMM|nr:SMP-30/gluconolactonase/LRE family protein [Pantoea deserta]RPD96795.1 SMP-30/gluconolactonase/LRE family protein [Pantoea deserta]
MKFKKFLTAGAFFIASTSALSAPLAYLQDIPLYQIPEADRNLQTVDAEKWLQVTDATTVLEGPSFDRQGNLLLTDVFKGQIIKIDPQRRQSVLFEDVHLAPSATAIGQDGHIYVAAGHKDDSSGEIFSLDGQGQNRRVILSADRKYQPNDLVLDKQGGIYFTDARGNSGDRSGGVYYISPGEKTISPVLTHLSGANGIALSPDGGTLWVVEFSAGVLHRLVMKNASEVEPFGETVAYRFNSPAPDSMKADNKGNLYIALHGQGRVIALNSNAIPVGQITIPGRDKGEFLRTANLAIRPGTHELYILSSGDAEHHSGAAVFRSNSLGKGQKE